MAAHDPTAPENANPISGLLPDEELVADLAVKLWAAWLKLPIEHPDERPAVGAAVHMVQDRLAMRVCRRAFPQGWPRHDGNTFTPEAREAIDQLVAGVLAREEPPDAR